MKTTQNQLRKAVFITGAAQRIGKAMALHLADRGYDIALHYHTSRTQALEIAKAIRSKGVVCELFCCDLSKQNQVALLLEKVQRKLPHLSVLINNASIFKPSSWNQAGLQALDLHWAINFRSPFILMNDFAQRCPSGQIINILDTKVTKNQTSYVGYLISKKALGELTRMAAVALAPHIRVNAIAPGIILAPVSEKAGCLKKRAQQIPLKKPGDVRYICQALDYLMDNSFVTGQTLFVDGGEHLI